MFAIVLSPIAVILGIPLAIGIGLDVFEVYGETPIVLALCAPLAIVLLRRLCEGGGLRDRGARLWSRLHLDRAGHLSHAP